MSKTSITRALGVGLLLLALAGAARADSGPLTLRGVTTGGGGVLSAGDYALLGAIGQPVAGELRAGEYRLRSGVIGPREDVSEVYLPLLRHE